MKLAKHAAGPEDARLAKPARLPVGVISTDAIEQLSPYVPEHAQRQRLRKRLPRRAGARPRPQRRVAQAALTAAPLLAGDLLALLGCLAISCLAVGLFLPLPLDDQLLGLGLAIASTYCVVGYLSGLFPATAVSPVYELRQLVISSAVSIGLVLVFSLSLGAAAPSQLLAGFIAGLLVVFALPLTRAAFRQHFSKYPWWGERVIVIGSGVQGRAIYNFYRAAAQRGLKPVGIVDETDSLTESPPITTTDPLTGRTIEVPYLGPVRQLPRIARRHSATWGIVAPGGCDGMDMLQVTNFSGTMPHLIILPSQFSLPSLWVNSCECAGVLGIHLHDQLRSPVARALKRTVDIALSSLGLLLSAPLFVVTAVTIKLKSPGPIFYGQRRIGRNGKPFTAWKIRTMVADADAVLDQYLENDSEMRQQWMVYQKLKNDPRVIPGIGCFLRKTSLDELPQLFNILRGEMSIVGPRPCMTSQIGLYQQIYPLYLRVRPGLTGLWQISGRNETSYEQRVRFDGYYVSNWSLWLDFYIALRTIRTLLLREGAY